MHKNPLKSHFRAYKCNKNHKIRCKDTAFCAYMQGLDEKKSHFVAIFLCLAFSYQYSVVSVQSSVFSNQFLDSAMTPFISSIICLPRCALMRIDSPAAIISFSVGLPLPITDVACCP